jgi:predicted nucleotide-binding protein
MWAVPVAEELLVLVGPLREYRQRIDQPDFADRLLRLEEAARDVGRAWSGSNLGYHSRVYYSGLQIPPPGEHFSAEWGFQGLLQGTTGNWIEAPHEAVIDAIRASAGNPDLADIEALAHEADAAWREARSEIVSILAAYLANRADAYLEDIRDKAEDLTTLTASNAARAQLPSGQMMTRDSLAASQGLIIAPHQQVIAEVVSLRSPFTTCGNAADLANRAAAYIRRIEDDRMQSSGAEPGDKVFIGHGGSRVWRDLKDFLQERLELPWDEFNRVPVAGVTNIARLSEMLNHAGVAFLVLTAEDEQADGTERARQNVVHEAGLFQGRLGFSRAIILLEEGCQDFSNIEGLGQIRFPAGNIAAAFEEVRRVLEREGFVEGPAT